MKNKFIQVSVSDDKIVALATDGNIFVYQVDRRSKEVVYAWYRLPQPNGL